VREGVVGEGGRCCSLFLHRLLLVASCCSLLACLLGVSLVSCLVSRVFESFISSSLWFEQFGVWNISLSLREREIEVEEMGDDALDRDARIKLSIGTKQPGRADGQFNGPRGLAFDHHRGLLLVADTGNHRVQVFSCDDGFSFVSKFGTKAEFNNPWGIAIDHDRILIVDSDNNRVQLWSLSKQWFLSCIGLIGSGRGIAIDKHHRRIIFTEYDMHRLVCLSSIDLSFLFSIGKHGSVTGKMFFPSGVAIDDDRHRIIVCNTFNPVQVLSSIDGSFLFEFGSTGNQPCQLNYPGGLCIDNQGRIIVADYYNYRLQAFTHEGHHISSFDCGFEYPSDVAFDEHRGLIAFTAGNRVHVIGANQWLADTFTWRPDRHRYAPSWMKQAVSTMTMIRSVVDESSAISMIPNELLFEIFSHLEGPELEIPLDHQHQSETATITSSSQSSIPNANTSAPRPMPFGGGKVDKYIGNNNKKKCTMM